MQVIALLTTCPPEQLNHKPMIRDFRDIRIQPDGDFLTIQLRSSSAENINDGH